MEITIAEVEPHLVLVIRKRGRYEEIATMIPKVCQFADEKGIQILGPPIFVCHEMTHEEAMKANEEGNADVEIAVPVSEKIEGTDEIKCYELSGGKMAKIIHKGPYEDCGPTYDRLFAWLEENGKKIVAPIREVYLNDPREVPPEEILTEIHAPIE
jgi:AraC family transcriptional regulator